MGQKVVRASKRVIDLQRDFFRSIIQASMSHHPLPQPFFLCESDSLGENTESKLEINEHGPVDRLLYPTSRS